MSLMSSRDRGVLIRNHTAIGPFRSFEDGNSGQSILAFEEGTSRWWAVKADVQTFLRSRVTLAKPGMNDYWDHKFGIHDYQ